MATTPATFNSIHEYLAHVAKKKSTIVSINFIPKCSTINFFLFCTMQRKSQQTPSNKKHYYTTKEILKGVSIYFNPGDLCAIMGPSGMCVYVCASTARCILDCHFQCKRCIQGCGKTTLLDLLTGRRTGNVEVCGECSIQFVVFYLV